MVRPRAGVRSRSSILLPLSLALALVLAGCGGDEAVTPSPEPSPTAPADDGDDNGEPDDSDEAYLEELHRLARDEGGLVLYSSQPTDRIERLIQEFRSAYPDVDVDFFRSDTAAVSERLATEFAAGQHLADVAMLTDRTSERAMEQNTGIFEVFEPRAVLEWPSEVRVEGNAYQLFGVNLAGLAYNTTCMDEEPASYEILLDPEWRGRIGIQDPVAGGGAESWVHMMFDHLGDEETWEEFMRGLAAQDPLYDSYLPVQNALAAGEICIHAAAYPDFIQPLKDDGAPVEWATVGPMNLTGLTIQLLAEAPNPNAGMLFIEFALGPEGQTILGETGLTVADPRYFVPAFERLAQASTLPNPFRRVAEDPDYWREKMEDIFGR